MTTHYVYRIYDAEARLIYIGCTIDVPGRLRAHRHNSWWSYQGVKAIAKVYPNKAVARAAERTAILSERPRWNLSGRPSRTSWTADEFVDFMASMLNSGEALTNHRRSVIRNVARQYRIRFDHDIPVQLPAEVAA